MCRLLGVSTSGYYGWRVRSPSRRAQQNQELSRRIAAVHAESRQIYGARRVWAELRAQGVTVSRRRVARLMRALGLQGVTRRKRRCTTRRDAQAAVAPDRVQRRFEAAEPNRLWVADITYVPTLEGFVYLATVLDVFSRKVVGWAMSARQTVDLVQSALGMAVTARAAQGVVLHSDRGSQYTALVFTRQCAAAGIERSMGSAGDCFDNAMAESLFATVECELLHCVEFATRAEAELEIFRFVEGFYNRKRRHSGLGYLSPVEFEQAWHTQQAAASAKGAATIAPGCCTFRVSRSRLGGQRAGNGGKTVGPATVPGQIWHNQSHPGRPDAYFETAEEKAKRGDDEEDVALTSPGPLRHHGAALFSRYPLPHSQLSTTS